jgi:photosystem II stability/assembly factor-like uncharacterized protein
MRRYDPAMTKPGRKACLRLTGLACCFLVGGCVAAPAPGDATASPPLTAKAGAPTPLPTGPDIREARLVSVVNGWALSDTALLATADSGQTWLAVTPEDVSATNIIGVFFMDVLHGWVVAADDTDRLALYGTIDGGHSWSAAALPGEFPDGVGAVSVAFIDPKDGWIEIALPSSSAESIGDLWGTQDGGQTWNHLTIPVGGPIEFLNLSDGWVAGGPLGGQLYRTVDGGQSWIKASVSLPAGYPDHQPWYTLPAFFGAEGVLPVNVFKNGGGPLAVAFYTTKDGGAAWTLGTAFTVADEGDFTPIGVSGPTDWVVASAREGLLVTQDSGHAVAALSPLGLTGGSLVDLDFASTSTGWAREQVSTCLSFKSDCSQKSLLSGTQDGGLTWVRLLTQ